MNREQEERDDEESSTKERLVRIETKLDALLDARVDQEARIRSLERRDAYVLGASTVLGFLASLLAKKFF